MTTEPWASAEDVSRHLGVPKDAVCRWIGQKGLLADHIGRRRKFEVTEVDEWVRAGGASAEERS